jgi:NAD(P)-dependent dehydrogenase (short-subunit alcohol dehydrogenase family)
MNRFSDRRIIISGAASGIGRATVLRLLAEGGTVTACDVDTAGLATIRDEAENAKQRLTTVGLDISSESRVAEVVDDAVERNGGLDVLVNAAGVQRCAHTHEHSLDDWNWVIGINLTGTFLMTRQALPALRASGRGVVVNFSSTSAQFAHPYMSAYAASKGGIQAFTHSLALEYARDGLRAVSIQPGGVSTSLANSTLDRMPEGADMRLWAKQSPLLNNGALATPSAVAGVVAMIASEDGSAITGTEIRVDSGAHA